MSLRHPIFLNSYNMQDHHTVLNAFLMSSNIASEYFDLDALKISQRSLCIASSDDLPLVNSNCVSSICCSISTYNFVHVHSRSIGTHPTVGEPTNSKCTSIVIDGEELGV